MTAHALKVRHRTRFAASSVAEAELEPLAPRQFVFEPRRIADLKPHQKKLRHHPPEQLAGIAKSIEKFGCYGGVVVDEKDVILKGHAVCEAAKMAGLQEITVVRALHLSEADKRKLHIADNKLAELGKFDQEELRIELTELLEIDLDLDIELLGFSTPEFDQVLQSLDNDDPAAEALPPLKDRAVTRPGDLWQMGKHRLFCGDARKAESYARLMGADRARIVVTDSPYNCKIAGHASGLGRTKHAEFAVASGELSTDEFIEFLTTITTRLTENSVSGSLHYLFIDHAGVGEMIVATQRAYKERKNILVWVPRPKHDLGFSCSRAGCRVIDGNPHPPIPKTYPAAPKEVVPSGAPAARHLRDMPR